jgi:hypothetical protein
MSIFFQSLFQHGLYYLPQNNQLQLYIGSFRFYYNFFSTCYPSVRTPLRYSPLTALIPAYSLQLGPLEPFLHDIGGTAYARLHAYRCCRTIGGAGAAFHATVMIDDFSLAAAQGKHAMRADHGAHGAAAAFFGIELKG